MTNAIVTPRSAVQLHTAVVAQSDLAASIAEAQHNGDLAYEFARRAGCPPAECAVSYHVAFADTMRELGRPMPCPCDLCNGGDSQGTIQ